MNNSEIVWEDPDEVRASGNQYQTWSRKLTPLIDSPGSWARVSEHASQDRAAKTALWLRRGAAGHRGRKGYGVPAGRWEFTSRTVRDDDNDPQFFVYARYLGPAPVTVFKRLASLGQR